MPRQKAPPVRTHQAQAITVNEPTSEDDAITVRVRHANGTDRFHVRPSQMVRDVRRLVGEATRVEPARVLLYRDMGCTEALDDDDELLGPFGLALEHGDMLSMREKEKAQRKQKASGEADGGAAKRPKGAAAKAGGEYLREGKTPRDIAIAFMTPDDPSRQGEAAYSQMSAAARLDAVAAKRAQLEVQRKGGKEILCATYTGNRKAFEERAPKYSRDELVLIMGEILSRQTTSSRRTASSASHLLNAEQLARRSPGMFWSVHALGDEAGATWDERMQGVLDAAKAELAS